MVRGSEISSYWARQTAASPRGGGTGWRVKGVRTPFLPHTPHHPTLPCHFTSDLVRSPRPSFMFTLTSFPRCHPSSGGRCSIMADTKLFKAKSRFAVKFVFYYVLFPESFIPNLTNASSLYRVLFSIYYKVGHFLDKKIMK